MKTRAFIKSSSLLVAAIMILSAVSFAVTAQAVAALPERYDSRDYGYSPPSVTKGITAPAGRTPF